MTLKRKPPKDNVRRVRSNGRTVIGTMISKTGRTIQCESFGERLLFLRFERDPSVQDYLSQPETLVFLDEQDKRHRYTPDAKVWKHDGSVELHEVTLTERMSEPAQMRRSAAATRICAERGWRYLLHTERSLPQPTEAANLEYLVCFAPAGCAHPDVTRAVKQLRTTTSTLPFANLLCLVEMDTGLSRGVVESAVGHLLWHRHIDADLRTTLLFTDSTPAVHLAVHLAVPEVEM